MKTSPHRLAVDPWPTERPLFILALLVSLAIWVVVVVSVVGLVYAILFGLFFAVIHVAFVAYVRGNAVRLGPEQFPDIHARVTELAGQMGLDPVPEAYLMQAGGALNAFATRFLRRHLIVLFSDLLDACGDNTAARDMIIAHELGHIRAGHLKYHWILLPAALVPFLSQALSRAREYTCDRYGLAGAGNTDSALVGLAILAAGGRRGPFVNRRALVAQRSDLNTGLMTIGEWLASHPPLAKRMLALEPALGAGVTPSSRGPVRAVALIVAMMVLPFAGIAAVALASPEWLTKSLKAAAGQAADQHVLPSVTDTASAAATVRNDLTTLGRYLDDRRSNGQNLPASADALYSLYWAEKDERAPVDPFDSLRYGYERAGEGYRLWSSGPDQESGTEDDIEVKPADVE